MIEEGSDTPQRCHAAGSGRDDGEPTRAVLDRTQRRARKQTSSRVFSRIMTLGPDGTAGACALSLARAHAQSANASMLRGYVGNNDTVVNAIVERSYAYAEKSLDDFHRLQAAAKAGDIDVADDPAR